MKSKAYWISPAGQRIIVKTIHIDVVVNNPEYFGLTFDYIKSIYNEEHEDIGTEGLAWKKIIINLIQQGWIRIRQYPKQCSWTVNVYKLNEQVIYVLNSWADEMLNSGVSQFDEVVIDLPGRQHIISFKEISKDNYYERNKTSIRVFHKKSFTA